jgi:hypothetical protein
MMLWQNSAKINTEQRRTENARKLINERLIALIGNVSPISPPETAKLS